VTEAHDRRLLGQDVPLPTFKERFDHHIATESAKGVNLQVSGKVLKEPGETGGPTKKSYEWWLTYGPLYVERWIKWRDERLSGGWKFAMMPDGEYGIEVGFEMSVDGERVVGFIDRVFEDENGQIVIVDIKSGNIPTSRLQLGVYRVGLMHVWGIEAAWGAYWMGSKGENLAWVDMEWYTDEYVSHQFRMAWAGITNGVFIANPSSMCKICGVREFCRSYGGSESSAVPIQIAMTQGAPAGAAPR
jgi:hypothetical protein